VVRRVLALVLLGLAAAGCGAGGGIEVPGGHAGRAQALVDEYGCGSCHVIPGLDRADGRVGPSLAGLSGRRTIAGRLPNTPENLMRWITAPQRVDPGNLMPDLGVNERDARDLAAYLEGR
jgi:cytochrome c2